MILTHMLVLLQAPTPMLAPAASLLVLMDAGVAVATAGAPRGLALLPALPVRAVLVLAVRGD